MQNGASKVFRLREQQLFKGVSDEMLTGANVRFATFAPGDVILHHGDSDSPFLLVVSGRVQALRFSEDGRETGFAFVQSGESYGETAIILGAPAIASITAITPVVVGLMERVEARRLFSDIGVSNALLRQLSNKLVRIVDNQVTLTRPSAYSRIYAVILALLKESLDEGGATLELPNQASIALAANVSRETVSRVVKTLLASGAITKEGRRFHVTDRSLIQKLAAAAPLRK
ncbi:Crp/Fnr family transcriptional regulator [Cupriavidus basilensis]|uniref:Crp/Fnr family transcriptional regulator n=1 Tax=Cupriavidus basilensis TaxID=68895 RepID=UPI0023E871D6|nr:Crp/Fnr family transcriptional regulator [Cupriavidus basilensis]MDF3886725.1 Crp/Fnr family transcriptional regulator [Cupriavidus basilensis]